MLLLNWTNILIFPSQLSFENMPYTNVLHYTYQISRPFSLCWRFIQRSHPSKRPFVTFRKKLISLQWGFDPMPNPQAGGPPLMGCPRLLIQYIYRYLPYLEAISSIHNPRMCHAVVTRDPPNMAKAWLVCKISSWMITFTFFQIYYALIILPFKTI
jgi:hypothetical protein